MANPSPVVTQKKKGLGCCGCGCLILALLLLLFLGAIGLIGYSLYQETLSVTTTTAANIPTYDGGPDAYATVQQKISAFNHDIHQHLPASLQLSGNELNTVIAHDAVFTTYKIRLFVTLENDQARLQASVPTDAFTDGAIKGRYLNGDTTFSMKFDPSPKTLNFTLQDLSLNEKQTDSKNLPTIGSALSTILNGIMQGDPDLKLVLDQAKTIEVRNGMLTIETQ